MHVVLLPCCKVVLAQLLLFQGLLGCLLFPHELGCLGTLARVDATLDQAKLALFLDLLVCQVGVVHLEKAKVEPACNRLEIYSF